MIIKKIIGKIPQHFIHELIEKTDLIELINKYIVLKKSGNNYKSLCPFHHEKTPSFTVSPQKQFFYCFGCGIHGNAIDFLMKYDKLDFLNSITELAIFNGINITYIKNNNSCTKKYFYKKKIYILLKKISKIYIKNLFKRPNAAYNYLIKRGLNKKIIKKFSLGFAKLDNHQITRYFQKKKQNISTIIDCGLNILDKKKKIYDRFQERIIFPIKDNNGTINGFGGRIISKKKHPKYLNSPETITFHKKKNLYGIYELTQHNPKPKKILVVEGYLDVISLKQFKIHYAVAILGTIITADQIKILLQMSHHIIFCFDGDKAGRNANWISLNLILPILYDNYKINFLLLPEKEDPSSLIIKEGKKKFEHRIKKSETLYSFFFKKLSYKLHLSNINDCIKLSYLAIPLIKKIPNKIIQICFRKMLGNKIGILDSYQLKKLMNISIQKKEKKKKNTKITTMRLIISLIIQNPELVKKIKTIQFIKKLNVTGKEILIELIELILKKKILKTGHLLEFYRNTKWEKIFQYLNIWDYAIEKKNIYLIFQEALNNLKIQHLENKFNKLITLERTCGLNITEKKKIWKINKKIKKLKVFLINKKYIKI